MQGARGSQSKDEREAGRGVGRAPLIPTTVEKSIRSLRLVLSESESLSPTLAGCTKPGRRVFLPRRRPGEAPATPPVPSMLIGSPGVLIGFIGSPHPFIGLPRS